MRGEQTTETEALGASFRYWEMQITLVRGPFKGREHVFTTDVVTVGKAPQNDIPLPDETVSRQHLEILRDSRGYLLKDLGSTNGTFLDGAEIREAYLRNGSHVSVGQTRFRFRGVQRRVQVEPLADADLDGLVGTGLAMRRAFGLARDVAPLDVTVLLLGEPGTGRRSLARVIHQRSAVQSAPFTLVDCGGEIPARLERLLFQERSGVLERVEGGTVVLLEPWELPPALQGRLAKAVRRRRSALSATPPTGGQRVLSVSSRDLASEAERGRMDPELRAALDRVRIPLPPLRERPEDVPALAAAFFAELGDATPVAEQQLSALTAVAGRLDWTGNVTALRQAVHALATLGQEQTLELLGGKGAEQRAFDPDNSFGDNKARWVETFERRYVAWLLERHGGNVSRAARSADMDRKHLHRLLKRYGLR